jgi:hypothetical protein
MGRRLIRGWIVGAAMALAAAPAQADTAFATATEAAPCLTASPDIAAFRAAFEAAGWEEVQDATRTLALHALGEIRYMVLRLPKIGEPEGYARFIELSHADAERDRDWDLVMIRNGLTMGMAVLEVKSGVYLVSCYLTGSDIPGVAQAMTRPDARLPDPGKPMFAALGFYSEKPELPGYDKLAYDWLLIDPPFDADPAPLARHSILVGYNFESDAPPMPPSP